MLNIGEYIAEQWQKFFAYLEAVEKGTIITNKWTKLAVKRYRADRARQGYEWRPDKVEMAFKFFYVVKINYRNRYRQFNPLPWQVFIVANLLGFYHAGTDRRRFRYAFIFIARKSGKTVFATILNLYFLVADGEADPQALLLASTREQASISLDYAKSVVLNSPLLAKRLNVMQYQIRYDKEGSRGFMKTLASNATHLDGYNPSSAILDEIHSYPDDSLFNVVKSGIIARSNPMILLISTAGFQFDSFCNDMTETMKNILKGTIEDNSFFGMLFTLDENDDYNDPKNWYKSNPALGEIITLEALEIEYNQAKNTPSQLPNFLTKNLNIFTQQTEAFIDDDILKARFKDIDQETLRGYDCYLGLDLSSTKDLTSLVALVVNPLTIEQTVFSYFWFADNPAKRYRPGGIDLTNWINQGFITQCQTKTIDYDLIVKKIAQLKEVFNIRMLAYDKFNSALIVPKVTEMEIDSMPFEQTASRFNFPLKFLEKQIYDAKINMDTSPVLRWNFRNIVLYADGNGNIKIMKNKSNDAVDGAVSLAMAMGAFIDQNINAEALALELYNQFDSNN